MLRKKVYFNLAMNLVTAGSHHLLILYPSVLLHQKNGMNSPMFQHQFELHSPTDEFGGHKDEMLSTEMAMTTT